MLGFMARLAGYHHVALSVKDIDVSVAWYRDVLGLQEELRLEPDGRRVAILRLPESRQQVGLVEHQGPSGFDVRNMGLDHVAFSVASDEELEAWARLFVERDVASSGIIETPFGGMVNFTDPDGIALALYWNR